MNILEEIKKNLVENNPQLTENMFEIANNRLEVVGKKLYVDYMIEDDGTIVMALTQYGDEAHSKYLSTNPGKFFDIIMHPNTVSK